MPAYYDTFRPTKFSHMVGNAAVMKSLQDVLDRDTSHAFLFTGPAGTGKTTLARISADSKGCEKIEVDAATHSGVDNMREIIEAARYTIAGRPRAIIVDECHRLSAQAWDTLLKITEEPGARLFWFLCSTDPKKVPTTIKTRCTSYEMKPLTKTQLKVVIDDVVEDAKLSVSKEVLNACAEYAGGSARQALTNLAKVERLGIDEAEEVLIGANARKEVIDLARFVLRTKGTWVEAMDLVADLKDESPEGLRIIISNYLGRVLNNAKSDEEAMRLLGVIQNWVVPYATNEGITPLLVSIGRSMFTIPE